MKFRPLALVAGLGALVALAPASVSAQERYVLPGSLADRIMRLADVFDPLLGAAMRGGVFIPENAQAQTLADVLVVAKMLEAENYRRKTAGLPPLTTPAGADARPPANVPGYDPYNDDDPDGDLGDFGGHEALEAGPEGQDQLQNVSGPSLGEFSDETLEDDVDGDLGDLGPAEVYKEPGESRTGWEVIEELEREMELERLGLSFAQLSELQYQARKAEEAYAMSLAERLLEQRRFYLAGDPNNYADLFAEILAERNSKDLGAGEAIVGRLTSGLLGRDFEFDDDGKPVPHPRQELDANLPPELQLLDPEYRAKLEALEGSNSAGTANVKPPPSIEELERRAIVEGVVDGYWDDDPDGTDGEITEVQPSRYEQAERWRRAQEALQAARERAAAEEAARADAEEMAESEPEYDTSGQLPDATIDYEEVELDTSGVALPDAVNAAIAKASCAAVPTAGLCRNIADPYQSSCLQAQAEATAQSCTVLAAQGESCIDSCRRNAAGMRRDEKLIGFARATVETNYRKMRDLYSAYPNFGQAQGTLDTWRDTALARWQVGAADLPPGQYCTGAAIDDWEAQCQSACSTNGRDPQTSLCRNGTGAAALAMPTSGVHLIPPGYLQDVAQK
ncbi:hypothetical protein [Oricola sp.]|uniref:hypothetical protein n=1 Tax=Oricola sp. TaxID=1979950 RepID=UPI0025FAB916|nr:hypothetical protein [Oricola sp.]MCI5078428.1 hypothetical protein [Oricola sp.]